MCPLERRAARELTLSHKNRDLRVKAEFRVRYKTLDDLVVAYAGNLSRGGIFIRTDKLLPADSIVRLHIELPDNAQPITVPCKVVHVRDGTDWGKVGERGMGLRFVDPSDLTRRRIERMILDAADAEADGPPSGPRQLDVLVVDDDAMQCRAAAEPFQKRGDEVRIARDGLEALAMALKEVPDIILCDVQMPRMDGFQFLRLLRARPALKAVPVLFLTTLASEEDRLLGFRLGVDDYIAKPYDPTDLVARADRAVLRGYKLKKPSAPDTEPDTGQDLAGEIEQVSVQSLLSFLEMEQKTGTLELPNGRIYLKAGRLLSAQAEELLPTAPPLQRLFTLFDCREGRFEFCGGNVDSVEDELKMSITSALLEHARVRDEASR